MYRLFAYRHPFRLVDPDRLRYGGLEGTGFRLGKFDYVLHEGEVVLLDVNRMRPGGFPERQRRFGQMLAAGIASFLS